MPFLYEILLNEFGKRTISEIEIPLSIKDNLKPGFGERSYQTEAFQRFILFYNEAFERKGLKPYHLLYNMATGSGKTLIMAGLILYLYEKGYRSFLFFVNSNNIIQKTKDNFLNQQAMKYLFNNKIIIDGKEVFIKEIDNFGEADDQNINIKFVSIQMLTSGLLTNVRENGLSFEDFEERKLVLIGDEAHHNNAEVWGDVVERIHKGNIDNVLLEFTATLDYEERDIVEKYRNKVIFKYDLSHFRLDGFSKEINLIRSYYEEEERIVQALILNLYRQELATDNNINLKPVILFKAKKTIKESEENKERFHKLIERLSEKHIENLQSTSTLPIIQKAFTYFESKNISHQVIVDRIKSHFKEENCISANNDAETELNQIRLNTLEDENNPIRAVFAVQKLNEGWDVLNLFDIVRLYDGRDGKAGNPGKTTIAEAQLIGRGARYFPFKLNNEHDKFTRKYDDDPANDLKVLEELFYHTKEDSKYISEIKKALIDSGIYEDDENLVTKQLTLKFDFKQTDFYKTGSVFYNKKIEKDFKKVQSFNDLGVKKKNFEYELSSGFGKVSSAFFELEKEYEAEIIKSKDIKLSDIPTHIIRFALSHNPFFYYSDITRYFPNIDSISDFINKSEYLAGLEITFKGTQTRLKDIRNKDYLKAVSGLLSSIEADIKAHITTHEGSDYIHDFIQNVFKDKEIRVNKYSERADGQEALIVKEPWYVYNANYGTKEEKDFVAMFARRFESINQKYDNIYLIRNERVLKIFDKHGRAFEPDFILFCKLKDKDQLTYQVFIEPKGAHLIANDKWKEEFLEEIRKEKKTINLITDKYRITGVPFYNNTNENEFKNSMEEVLGI
ncbi:MAG: DEAD/DEAH box helicase family protein [Spirochaetes bacterium]|nr:DEAD/DEAH box helicase family protein [Spirochaetota bacterium]